MTLDERVEILEKKLEALQKLLDGDYQVTEAWMKKEIEILEEDRLRRGIKLSDL